MTKAPFVTLPALAICVAATAMAQQEIETQKESDWRDARWNQTVLGNFQATMLPLPNGTVAKGLCVRLGDTGGAAIVYDTGACTLRGGWTGDFLKFDPARYGLIQPPRPAGSIRFLGPALKPSPDARWKGLRVHGARVVVEYSLGGVSISE